MAGAAYPHRMGCFFMLKTNININLSNFNKFILTINLTSGILWIQRSNNERNMGK